MLTALYSVYVIVQDEDGNQDWAFDEIWVQRSRGHHNRTDCGR